MSYIYTVKPIKEATQIAIKLGQFDVEEFGNISIYGICRENWPAGVSIKSTERITDGYIYNVGKIGYTIPVSYFTETEEADEADKVPKFIKGLYEAMTKDCGLLPCQDCPLNLLSRHADCDCGAMVEWTRKRWFSK